MTPDGPAPGCSPTRTSRYDGALLASFLAGGTLDEAARAAGCSRSTAKRRKEALAAELEAGRRQLVETTLATMQLGLPAAAQGVTAAVRELGAAMPAAARRLAEVVQNPESETSVAIRASVELLTGLHRFAELSFATFARLAEQSSTADRLSAIEATLAARTTPAATRPWKPTLLGGANP